MKWFWRGIWNISEFTGIGLGRLAPYVFGGMIGRRPHSMNQEESAWKGLVRTITVLDRPVNFSAGETLRIDVENGRWHRLSPWGEILESGELNESQPTADKSTPAV